MATLYPMSRLTKAVVEEKETRMRELMKIMGLRDWAHQFAWTTLAVGIFFWIALSITWVCSASFLPKSSRLILFVYFFSFCISEVGMSFLISTIFSNSKLAAIVAPVILFASILPRYIFYSTNENEQYYPKLAASLLSPTAFSFGADYIANAEYVGVGVHNYNIAEGKYNLVTSIQMMLVDAFLYFIFAWFDYCVVCSRFAAKFSFAF